MDGDRLAREQDPAYRATLLLIWWAQVKSALTFLHFACTSSYITCRRFRCFYGQTMGRYGRFDGQISNYKKSQGELLISQGVFTESPTSFEG